MASKDNLISIGLGLDIQDLRTGLSDAKREMALAESEFMAATAGLDKWDQSIEGVVAKLEQMGREMEAKQKIVQAYRNELERVTKAYGENSTQAQEVQTKLNKAEASYTKAQKYTENLQKKLEVLQAAETGAGDEADGLAGSLADMGDAASRASSGGLEALRSKMTTLRDKVVSQMTSKVKELATGMVNLGIDFSGTMSEVQAISGATKEQMEELEATAREFGATTTFSATESAEALKYMALAGWDTQQSTEALGGVLDLAASSGMNLANASDMVTDYITAFGLEAQDAGKFADMLAYAQSHANTTAEALGEAYSNSAAVMAASGQTVETTTALLSKMADAGLKGSNAGTALSAMMRDITKKMKNGAIQIGETAVAVVDAQGNFRSLTDILVDVEDAVEGMGTAEQASALQTTFTADSIKGLNLVLGQGARKVRSFEGELTKSDGTAKQMAETMNDNLGGDIKKLQSAFEELQLKLFDLLEGPLRGVVDFITNNLPLVITLVGGVGGAFAAWKVGSILKEMTAGFKAVIPVIKTLTSTTALSTAGQVAHTAATTAMTAAQGLATAATTALSGAMAFLAANPIMLVVAAIAAIGTALFLLYDNCEWFRDAVDGIIDAVVGFFQWAYDEIIKVWDTLVEFFEGIWNGIQDVFGGVGDFFGGVAEGAVDFFEDPWGSTTDFFGDVWNGIQDAFSGVGDFFEDVGKTANDFFQDPWGTTERFFEDTVSTVKNCFVGVAEFFGINGEDAAEAFEQAWSAVKDFFGGIVKGIESVFGGIGDFFGKVGEGAVRFFEDPWGSVTGFFGGIWDGIKGVFGGVGDFFGGVFDGAVNGIKNAFNGIKSFFEGIFNGIVGFFKPILGIFGIEIDSGTDSKLRELEDRVATLKDVASEANRNRNRAGEDYRKNLSAYGYNDSRTVSARTLKNQAENYYGSIASQLSAAEKELAEYKSKTSEGSGGFAESLKKSLESGLSGVTDIITKPFKAAWDGITGIFGGIGSWFSDNVLKPVGEALGSITDAVGDVVGGVADGIASGANDVVGGVQKFGEDIFNGFCDFFGIHSPSTLMRDKIGLMIGEGMAEGIRDSAARVRRASDELGGEVSLPGSMGRSRGVAGAPASVVFNQTINSPEPLSAGQIYRDTRSLIARREWA